MRRQSRPPFDYPNIFYLSATRHSNRHVIYTWLPLEGVEMSVERITGCVKVQWGLVLRRFNFTTLAESDRALLTCGASLSQLRSPLAT
jgi:hypothetical protein